MARSIHQESNETVRESRGSSRSRFVETIRENAILTSLVVKGILEDIFQLNLTAKAALNAFTASLAKSLKESAGDANVVGFKSIVCYRTGLNVAIVSCTASLESSLVDLFKTYKEEGRLRLAHKALNDLVVRIAVEMASEHDIPGKSYQFSLKLAQISKRFIIE